MEIIPRIPRDFNQGLHHQSPVARRVLRHDHPRVGHAQGRVVPHQGPVDPHVQRTDPRMLVDVFRDGYRDLGLHLGNHDAGAAGIRVRVQVVLDQVPDHALVHGDVHVVPPLHERHHLLPG